MEEEMRDPSSRIASLPLDRGWRPELVAATEPSDTSGESALGRHGLTSSVLRDTVARLPHGRRTTVVHVATPLIEWHGERAALAAQRMETMVTMRAAPQEQTKAVAVGERALHRISPAPGRLDVSCSLFAFRAEPAKAASP